MGLDAFVVVLDLAEGVALDRAGEEGVFHLLQFAGDVVFIQKLCVAEDGEKDFLGEDVLDEHFIHVVRRDGGIDGAAAEFEKGLATRAEQGVVLALLLDHPTQGSDDVGNIVLEALDGFAEFEDILILKRDVGGEKFVEGLCLQMVR